MLRRKPRALTFDGELEAHLVALACSSAQEGRTRWTVRLLATKAVELGVAPRVAPMTVHRVQKNNLRPDLKRYWRIPPRGRAAFVSWMDDVLQGMPGHTMPGGRWCAWTRRTRS